MAVKKKATQEVVRAGKNLPALPPEWETELANQAEEAQAKETPDVQQFSLRAGVLAYGGTAVPGNKMQSLVLATSFERAWFPEKFDPNNIVPPQCFALSESGDDMAPHANSRSPQSKECEDCPKNEWGSDPRPSSRGKACKETRRLALISDTALEDLDNIEDAAIGVLRVNVTSVGNWKAYVHKLGTAKRPPWSVITEISVTPDPKNQFAVNFDLVEPMSDPDELKEVNAQLGRGRKLVMVPYQMAGESDGEGEEEEAEEKPARKRNRKY